jgi:phospholipase C
MTTNDGYTRRKFLRKSGTAGVAVLGGTLWATSPAAARARRLGGKPAKNAIKHLIISCQENRSFDHYFGYAAQVQAKGYGPPPGYTQPDSAGVGHAPYELAATRSPDPPHSWTAVHAQYDGGRMDGFYRDTQRRTGAGEISIPYYTQRELAYYYSLFSSTTRRCARTTSARCSGRRGRTAST